MENNNIERNKLKSIKDLKRWTRWAKNQRIKWRNKCSNQGNKILGGKNPRTRRGWL